MTSSIRTGAYAFLIRLDLMFFMSLWNNFQLEKIKKNYKIKKILTLSWFLIHSKLKVIFDITTQFLMIWNLS